MTTIFKKTLFREDPSIDFYRSSNEFNSYVTQTYINTGKILLWRQEEYLDDTLKTVTYETIFRDREAFNEAVNDLEFKKDADQLTRYCYDAFIRLVSVNVDNNQREIECDPERLTPVDITDL
jgi:hypothetical protein